LEEGGIISILILRIPFPDQGRIGMAEVPAGVQRVQDRGGMVATIGLDVAGNLDIPVIPGRSYGGRSHIRSRGALFFNRFNFWTGD